MTQLVAPALDVQCAARRFSAAAGGYDEAASLQAETRQQLLALLPEPLTPRRVLDLGCGTGLALDPLTRRYPEADLWALDRALGMVTRTQARGRVSALVADAQALPLGSGACDFLFSNLVLQWCANVDLALAECFRVLSPGGVMALSLPVDDTLSELRHAWRAVDEAEHVHRFMASDLVCDQALRCGFTLQGSERRRHLQHFPTVRALMQNLRAIGAGNVSRERRRGLLTSTALSQLEDAYPRLSGHDGIVATWDILYLLLQRP